MFCSLLLEKLKPLEISIRTIKNSIVFNDTGLLIVLLILLEKLGEELPLEDGTNKEELLISNKLLIFNNLLRFPPLFSLKN
jgi:hypothetical protein